MRTLLALQNFVNQTDRNAEKHGYLRSSPSFTPKAEYARGLKIGQFSNGMKLPFRRSTPISVLSARVFGPTHPFKIFWPIIHTVSVKVIYRCIVKRGAAGKGCAYEPMSENPFPYSAALCDYHIVAGLRDLSLENLELGHIPSSGTDVCSNAPQTRRLKPVHVRNWFPNLRIGINRGISHIERSMFVVGQGRALLAQCFRPAFSSRITVCSQALGAL